jgi:hypothetical protein
VRKGKARGGDEDEDEDEKGRVVQARMGMGKWEGMNRGWGVKNDE